MAGTQELDRLLEELRITSMNMAAGLPPPTNSYNIKSSTSLDAPRKLSLHNEVYPDTRYPTFRSASTSGFAPPVHNFNDTMNYSYHKQSGTYSERSDKFVKSNSSRYLYTPPSPRHQSVFTTTLKQRPPVAPKRYNQVHLTIDPECGTTEGMSGATIQMNDHELLTRERKLESELRSAREELAHLKRAMSLMDEHHQRENHLDSRNLLSPVSLTTSRSAISGSQQLMNSTYQRPYQRQGSQSGFVSYPRAYPRQQNTSYNTTYATPKRTMSHTNVCGTKTWNLRSYQGSESDLAYKRESTCTTQIGRSGYSARRERLKQEREQEQLLRQQRLSQLAASTTGLNEHRHLQQHHQQHHYRSTSAVNRPYAGREAYEESETITLQPIGRGVQDLDSHMGSMTALTRGGTASSMIEGLHRTNDSSSNHHVPLARQPFSSTQYLHRTQESSHIESIHRSPIFSNPSALSRQSSQLDNSIPVLDRANTPHSKEMVQISVQNLREMPNVDTMQNGWQSNTNDQKQNADECEDSNMSMVRATARVWYRPKLSREEAIKILRQQAPGSFLIRDSTTYKDAFGLAVKVATLPPKVTPKSGFTSFVRTILNDLQSELVRHYLIEAVNTPTKGVRLKGFASEPVFQSLAALINRHTQDALALPCRLILPPLPTTPLPPGYVMPPQIVMGKPKAPDTPFSKGPLVAEHPNGHDSIGGMSSGLIINNNHLANGSEVDDRRSIAVTPTRNSQVLPFECVIKDDQRRTVLSPNLLNQGMTYRCIMLGSVDTPQWNNELCFARAVDQLIPLETLNASECDHGISRVRYSEVQLHVSPHDGITIIDLLRRLFLRRHLPNNMLLYCGVESRKKEFIHPDHQNLGITKPKIFGLVVRKGISECTCHVFSECDPVHTAESIVSYIRTAYPHMKAV